MTSLLERHEQVPGCWGSTSTAVVAEEDDVVGGWLAEASLAESGSWMALRAVGRELEAHDAPAQLVRRALAAAGAALHNAATLETLALRWGALPRQPQAVSIAVRPLEAFAVENAVQGCVRETWSALEARFQSLAARDPVIRRTMEQVAWDGLRHAELSWTVDAWARRRLERSARARVGRARLDAVHDLLEGLRVERERELCVEAGLPTVATARGLAQALCDALWSRPLPN